MQIESRARRQNWLLIAGAIAFDVIVSGILAQFWDDTIMAAVAIFVLMQVASFVTWIRRTAWSWLVFWRLGRRQLSKAYLDYLKNEKFPKPKEYLRNAQSYFSDIIEDRAANADVRIKAAYQSGQIEYPMSRGFFQIGLREALAWEDALTQFDGQIATPTGSAPPLPQ